MTTMLMLAQATAPTGDAPPAGTTPRPGWADLLTSPMLPLILGMLVLFIFMSRSKSKQEKQRQKMLSELKKGDRVQTIGGILGTVVDVRENEVLLKVDEGSNTKIRFSRSAIHRVTETDKAEAK